MIVDHFDVFDFCTGTLINVGRSETDYNVKEEEHVDDDVDGVEPSLLEWLRIEAYIQWDNKHIKGCENHDKQVPLGLSRVIDAEQARIFRLLLVIGFEVVLNFTLFVLWICRRLIITVTFVVVQGANVVWLLSKCFIWAAEIYYISILRFVGLCIYGTWLALGIKVRLF